MSSARRIFKGTRCPRVGSNLCPGGGAEIFDPQIRTEICPRKADARTWLAAAVAVERVARVEGERHVRQREEVVGPAQTELAGRDDVGQYRVARGEEETHHRLKVLRVHGSEPKYYHKMIGGNFRLDALQAAIVAIKLDYLDDWTRARQKNAAGYRELFAAAGLMERVGLPIEKQDRHIYNQFVVRVENGRDDLRTFLGEQGIGTEVYYPVPLHLQDCFAGLNYGIGDFPVAEAAAKQTLALPIYPELTDAQQAYVVEKIGMYFNR